MRENNLFDKIRILLVEDEEYLRDAIKINLELEGYEVTVAGDGMIALEKFRSSRYDLVILDVMLPEMDGFAVCQAIRLENDKLPVLFLTAKDNSLDRVQGLKLGADDYLTKPFNLEEFLLRIRNLLKRSKPLQGDTTQIVFRFGDNRINFATYEVTGVKGKKFPLSKREIQLLRLLVNRKNEVVSRKDILDAVWGYNVYPSTRTIDNFILLFRKYFEKDHKEPRHFHSVRGVGYRFTP